MPTGQPPQQVVVVQTQQNGLGVAGFVTSLVALLTCGILTPISLILSLVALRKEPRGLAIAGTVISGIQIIIVAMVGITPILALLGFGMASHQINVQNDAFRANRTAIMEEVRAIDGPEDKGDFQRIYAKYGMVTDQEFSEELSEAQKRAGLENYERYPPLGGPK